MSGVLRGGQQSINQRRPLLRTGVRMKLLSLLERWQTTRQIQCRATQEIRVTAQLRRLNLQLTQFAEHQLYPRAVADYVSRWCNPDWLLAEVRTRAMTRQLRGVEQLPEHRAQQLLPGLLPDDEPDADSDRAG